MSESPLLLIAETLAASIEAKRGFVEANASALVAAAADLAQVFRGGGKLLLFGNGGSAADAQHIATEFVVRMDRERAALPAIALTTDSSVLTAAANDLSFEQVFARQVEAAGRPGDAVLAFSTSGNSPNVVRGLQAAESRGLLTIGLLGRDGGKCRAHCRHALVVPHRSTQRIQESHIFAGHLLVELVEDQLLLSR